MTMMVEYFLWNVWKHDEENKRKWNFLCVVGFGGFRCEKEKERDFERMLAYGWYGVGLVFGIMMWLCW